MIQRPQSIYLGLAFICMVMMLFFPIYTVTATHEFGSTEISLGAHGMEGGTPGTGNFPLYLIYISLALISLAAIFTFKKRPRQLLITRLGLILHFLVALTMTLFYYLGQDLVLDALNQLNQGELDIIVNMGPGIYFLLSTVPFYILAVRGIKRDENLVKSLDRLR